MRYWQSGLVSASCGLNGVSDLQLTAIAKQFAELQPDARAEACKAFCHRRSGGEKQVARDHDHLTDKDAVTAIWACAAVAQMKEAGQGRHQETEDRERKQ